MAPSGEDEKPPELIMSHDLRRIACVLAAGAMLSAVMLGYSSPAASQSSQAPPASTPSARPSEATPQPTPGGKASPGKMSPADRVEKRITDLHARLHITPSQEMQWNGVAQAMRDNAKTMEAIVADRSRKMGTMSAVDDLRAYEILAEAHADGMKKLVAAFAPLYDSLSDSQKKTADDLFRHHERHMPTRKQS
jgi:periplasmic protein CpxP/Spy